MTPKLEDLRRTIKPVYLLFVVMLLALLVTLELAENISSWRLGAGSGHLMNPNYNENTEFIESNRNVEARQLALQTPELGMGKSNHERWEETRWVDGTLGKTEQGNGIDWTLYRISDNGRKTPPLDDEQSRIQQGNTLASRISGRVASLSFTDLLNNATLYNVLHSLVRERFLPNYYLRDRRDARTESEYKESHVVFMHVHKCGGTTVKRTLSRIGKEEQIEAIAMAVPNQVHTIYTCFGQGSTGDSTCHSLRAGDDSRRRIFAGSASFGVCDSLRGRPCSYFTVLREPVDRIVSSYLFCQDADDNCGMDVAGSSITDWALRKGSKFFNLLHWSKFALRQGRATKQIMDTETRRSVLDYFLQNLENWFSFIGITEEMDMSLNMLGDVYGFHVEQVLKVNEGNTKSRMDQQRLDNMRETLRSNATVMEALYEDIMLYRKGKEIFAEQVKQFNKKK